MQATLLGCRRVDMTSQDTGQRIGGYTCFFSYPSAGVEGLEAGRQFVSDDLASGSGWHPEVGKPVVLDYTPKGKLSFISAVSK